MTEGLGQFIACPICHTASGVHGKHCELFGPVDVDPVRSTGGQVDLCRVSVARGGVIEACGTLLTADGHCGRAAGHLR